MNFLGFAATRPFTVVLSDMSAPMILSRIRVNVPGEIFPMNFPRGRLIYIQRGSASPFERKLSSP
jgi:hypothetical protein